MKTHSPSSKRRTLAAMFILLISSGIALTVVLWMPFSDLGPDPNSQNSFAKDRLVLHQSVPQYCEWVTMKPAHSIKRSFTPPATMPISVADVDRAKAIANEIAFLNENAIMLDVPRFRRGTSNPNKKNRYILITKEQGYEIALPTNSSVASPTIYDGNIYLSGGFNQREFYSVRMKDGRLNWSVTLSDDGPSSAIVTESTVILNTESCTIFALDRHTGRQRWSYYLGDPLLTHPATDGRYVYVGYPDFMATNANSWAQLNYLKPSHTLAALDIRTGKVAWRRWIDGDVMTTPVVCESEVFITTFTGTVYRLEADSGKILAAAPIMATSLPTVTTDRIYTTQRLESDNGPLEAVVELDRHTLEKLRTLLVQPAPYLDAMEQDGTRYDDATTRMDAGNAFVYQPVASGWKLARKLIGLSRVSAFQNYIGSSIATDGKLSYNCMGNRVVCIDLNSGDIHWEHEITPRNKNHGGHAGTMPILVGPYAVMATVDGDVLLLDRISGKISHNYHIDAEIRNPLVADDGLLFATSMTGGLHCINTQMAEVDGWPSLLRNNARNVCAN